MEKMTGRLNVPTQLAQRALEDLMLDHSLILIPVYNGIKNHKNIHGALQEREL